MSKNWFLRIVITFVCVLIQATSYANTWSENGRFWVAGERSVVFNGTHSHNGAIIGAFFPPECFDGSPVARLHGRICLSVFSTGHVDYDILFRNQRGGLTAGLKSHRMLTVLKLLDENRNIVYESRLLTDVVGGGGEARADNLRLRPVRMDSDLRDIPTGTYTIRWEFGAVEHSMGLDDVRLQNAWKPPQYVYYDRHGTNARGEYGEVLVKGRRES